jgi:PAS domain S-box-containing protein
LSIKQWFRLFVRHLPVVALLCSGFILSALTFHTLRSLEAEKAKSAFERAANVRFDDLQTDLELTISKVTALGAFCESTYPVAHSSFDGFATPLFIGHDPGIKALEWIPRVTLGDRARFEKSARASGITGFEIRDRIAQGKMVRSGDRPEYFPVLFVQPYAGNEIATGYDLASSSTRREALERAAASGEAVATRRITLVQETSGQYGILIFQPVHQHEIISGKRELLGFAVGVLRVGAVVEKHGANSGVDLTISDLDADPSGNQLYPYPSLGKRPQPVSDFTRYRTIPIGGRNWQVVASPVPGAFPVVKTYSYAGCALTLLITFLVAAYLWNSLGRHMEVEHVVEERTGALNFALHSLAEVHRGLEESEARYRRLIEDSPSAIVVERQGKIMLVNRAAVEIFGIDVTHNHRDHCMMEFVAPDRKVQAAQIIADLYEQDTQVPMREARLLRGDGTVFDAEIASSSYVHEGQRSIQMVIHDISQRKRDEAQSARLIQAIEQAGESIVITDLDANIVYVNPAFERISGYSRQDAIGQNPRVLKSGRHSEEFYTALWETLKAGESWSGHFVNRTKSGRLYTEEATISPVLNRSGEIINYVAVKRDVTLETELREQLQQSQKMDAVGRLAGGVAHDFNNMLMVIMSYAELLASKLPESDPCRKYTGHILHAAERSSALTRQLLAFSRKQVFAPRVIDCNSIIVETSNMVRRLIAENIDLHCDLMPGLWRVKADSDQIVQVILNLCVNSRDAMPGGGTLTLATRNYQVDHGYVELSVSDTGIGIPKEIQEKLFEPFFTTKELGKGTGLGLSTVYGIVQQSGGYIRVESEPGQGATFRIYLPRCLEEVPSGETPAGKLPQAEQSLVLVVEDEAALREAIAAQLRGHDYKVLAAADGLEALDMLANNPAVAVLITDLIMPRMGGRELIRIASQRAPNLRIMVMSGYADQAFHEEDCNGCPTAFLQKPFSLGTLMSRLAELNNRPHTEPAQRA